MSKSTPVTLLLGFLLVGAYIVSKNKKDALKRVDVMQGVKQTTVKVPDGYHLMPDGSLMKNEDHNKSASVQSLPTTYNFGGVNRSVSF